MAIAFCPDCEESISLSQPKKGELLICPHCDAELEVINLAPLELDWAYVEPAEDWDEEDWEEWEEEEEEEWEGAIELSPS